MNSRQFSFYSFFQIVGVIVFTRFFRQLQKPSWKKPTRVNQVGVTFGNRHYPQQVIDGPDGPGPFFLSYTICPVRFAHSSSFASLGPFLSRKGPFPLPTCSMSPSPLPFPRGVRVVPCIGYHGLGIPRWHLMAPWTFSHILKNWGKPDGLPAEAKNYAWATHYCPRHIITSGSTGM